MGHRWDAIQPGSLGRNARAWRGNEDPTLVLCSKVRPCLCGCGCCHVFSQASGAFWKLQASKWRKSTVGTGFVSLGHSKQQEEHGGKSSMVPLQHPHPVSTGRGRNVAQATASRSSVGGKYPLSLSKMRRKIIQNRADVPPHMLIEPAVISQGRKSHTFGIWVTCSSCYTATGAVLLYHHLFSLCQGKEGNHTQSLSSNFGSHLVVQI